MRGILISIKRFLKNKNTVTILAILVSLGILYWSYQYRINPFIDDNEFYHVENREIRSQIYKLENKLAQLEYMTELVIEVGDMHE